MAIALSIGLEIHWTILLLPIAMAVTYLFVFGIVLSLAVCTVYFRDIKHLVTVILSCFFYLIPIVYPIDRVPEKYQLLFQLNPFTHFINLFRQIVYYGTPPTAQEWLVPLALAGLTLMIGFFILMNKEKDIIFRL
jgi:ABC-type polysaccharide/polyol phosphate export permease